MMDPYIPAGFCGDSLLWSLYDNTLIVSGSGYMYDWLPGFAPWHRYREVIKTVTIESGVWSIGNYAFQDCTNLESAVIANSVSLIGNCAFYRCCNLENVVIGNYMVHIGEYAFFGCFKTR